MTDLDTAIRVRLAMATPEDVRGLTRTLAAVLDLHEPHPSLPGECFRCDTGRPCKTLRVIAEKLGVEHD